MNGRFKCREVKPGFCRKISMQTGSSETLIGWKSGHTTFVPLWDQMEGSWLWTLQAELRIFYRTEKNILDKKIYKCTMYIAIHIF
jgi:hypothetical protein